jgi:hypothetical protein
MRLNSRRKSTKLFTFLLQRLNEKITFLSEQVLAIDVVYATTIFVDGLLERSKETHHTVERNRVKVFVQAIKTPRFSETLLSLRSFLLSQPGVSSEHVVKGSLPSTVDIGETVHCSAFVVAVRNPFHDQRVADGTNKSVIQDLA